MQHQKSDKIVEIFNELKDKRLIVSERIIESSTTITSFKSSTLKSDNKIFYNPMMIKLDDYSIRFCLLHEEGHFVNTQYGFYCFPLCILIGCIPFIVTCFVIHSNPVHQFFSIIIVPLVFFLSWKIFPRYDELKSDEFASRLLKKYYNQKTPSKSLERALEFIYQDGISFSDSHPSPKNRITNINKRVDEKNNPLKRVQS